MALEINKDLYISSIDVKLEDLPEVYTTTERKIGIWLNNKPIYQKTFVFTDPGSNGQYYYAFSNYVSNNIDEVIDMDGFFVLDNGAYRKLGGSEFPSGSEISRVFSTGSSLSYQRTAWDGSKTVYATVKYTKTTD